MRDHFVFRGCVACMRPWMAVAAAVAVSIILAVFLGMVMRKGGGKWCDIFVWGWGPGWRGLGRNTAVDMDAGMGDIGIASKSV
jgi:hypothetical protein